MGVLELRGRVGVVGSFVGDHFLPDFLVEFLNSRW